MALLDDLLDPIFGSTKAEDDRIAELQMRAMNQAMDFRAPQIGDVDLDRYSYLGDYLPETIDATRFRNIDPTTAAFGPVSGSAYDDIALDGSTREAQLAALAKLSNITEAGGHTAMDEANLNRGLNQASTQARGAREAIKADMGARGMGGSGMELLAQLQAQQGAQNMANQNSLDIAGQAQSRALDALMQQGQMAGSMRSQDYDQQARRAAAKDAINQFNSANMYGANRSNADTANAMAQYNQGRDMGIAQYNTGVKNQAGLNNYQGRQGLANSNVDLGNQQQLQNKIQNTQQNFANNSQVMGVQQGAYQQGINADEMRAQRKDKRRSDLIGAAIKGATAAYTGGV